MPALTNDFDNPNIDERKQRDEVNKSCQNIFDEFTNNPQALKKQADVIVSSAARVVTEENYLKNSEISIEDDYDSIDGIINNGNKQEEYDKVVKTQNKEPENKEISENKSSDNDNEQSKQRKKSLISRKQIKQNADKIAQSEHREQGREAKQER